MRLSCGRLYLTLRFCGLQPVPLLCPWNSPGKSTGVGCYFLLQGIFLTRGLNLGFLHWRQILYQLSHKRNPRILEWAAYPFPSGSYWPRVSWIAGGFFTSWAIREAQEYWSGEPIPSPVDLPDSGVEPGSPRLQADSLPAEPQEKPRNTGVGSLSLLQRIFLTQGLNQGLRDCRQILYQLSLREAQMVSA